MRPPRAAGVSDRANAPARRWLVFAFAVVAVQAVYWLALSPLLSQRTALKADAIVTDVEVAALDDATLAAARTLEPGAWSAARPGWSAPSSAATHAFRFIVDLDAIPAEDLGLIAGFGADNVHVWVNGFPVIDDGRLGAHATLDARRLRGVLRVPTAMLRPGANEVMAIATRRTPGYTDLFPSAWGDYDDMRASTARRAFMVGPFRDGIMILFGLTAAFAWVLVPVSANRAFVGWFAVLTTALALQIAERRLADPPWPPEMVTVIYFALGILVATAWLNLLDAWSGRGWPLARRVAAGLGAALIAACAAAILRDGVSGYDFSGALMDGWTLVAGLSAAAVFVWRLPARGPERPWEAAALLVGVVALVTDAGFQIFAGRLTGHLTSALPFLTFALVAAVLARNVRIYESMGALNAELNARLAAREAEIEAHHARLRDIQRARDIADERQRIMRDMHDGLGGQLMSMLLAARRGEARPERVADGLETMIDEMRLMIDSMDTVGASIGSALALFRARISERVRAAGFAFEYDDGAEEPPRYGPRETLQIFRILQEAVTNALKHSGGRTIRVRVEPETGTQPGLRFTVADDGEGLDAEATPGRGLENMRARARAIGGEVTIDDAAPGVRVVLRAPAPADTARDAA